MDKKAPFADWLNHEMEIRDLNQTDLAKASKISRQTINNILNERRIPGPEICTKLARGLGISPIAVFQAAGHLHTLEDTQLAYEWENIFDQLETDQEREEVLEFAKAIAERIIARRDK